jgi:hypothetical protein
LCELRQPEETELDRDPSDTNRLDADDDGVEVQSVLEA